jgi:hypothetical protein
MPTIESGQIRVSKAELRNVAYSETGETFTSDEALNALIAHAAVLRGKAALVDAQGNATFNPSDETQLHIVGGAGDGRFVNTGNVPVASSQEAGTFMAKRQSEGKPFCTNADGTIDGGLMQAYAYGRVDGATKAEIGVAKFYCNPDGSGGPALSTYRAPGSTVPVTSSSPDLSSGSGTEASSVFDPTDETKHTLDGKAFYDTSAIPTASFDDAQAYMVAHPEFGTNATTNGTIDGGWMQAVASGRVDGATTAQIGMAKFFCNTPDGQGAMQGYGRNTYQFDSAGTETLELSGRDPASIPAATTQEAADFMKSGDSVPFKNWVNTTSGGPGKATHIQLLQDYAAGKVPNARESEVAVAKRLLADHDEFVKAHPEAAVVDPNIEAALSGGQVAVTTDASVIPPVPSFDDARKTLGGGNGDGVKAMEFLEDKSGKGIINGRFGTMGIQQLASITDETDWNIQMSGSDISWDEGRNYVSAAKALIAPENASQLSALVGSDGIVEKNGLQ